jgi:long-chain acyl-CoA synthetase
MITHANIMATLRSLTSVVRLGTDDRFLSFLPLSHITERSVSHFGQIASGGETWFSRDLASVPTDLRTCRPTLFFAVPRVWEKFRDAVVDQVEHAPPLVRGALRDYLALAVRRGEDGDLEPFQRARLAALDASAGHLLRHRLGLDRARILTCGAAPVHPGLLQWFHAIGLPVAEGYGQTEVSLCTTLNLPGRTRIGTVGPPIPGVEVRIAPDREILVRSDGVCRGYWGRPEATAELIDADGWLHTGDLGSLDDDGYLRVTGRKKDLIVTAYGKNISPSEIESALEDHPIIAHAVVIGDGRPHLVALIDLDRAEADNWAVAHGFGRALGEDVMATEALRQQIDAAVEEVNGRHAPPERIRRWRLLPRELKVGTGDLTPTLKVRRQAVVAANAELVEEMYATTAT